MCEQSAETAARDILGRLLEGEGKVTAVIGGTRYVFIQAPANDFGFHNAVGRTKLVYYCRLSEPVLPSAAGKPFTLFGMNTGSELCLVDKSYPFDVTGLHLVNKYYPFED